MNGIDFDRGHNVETGLLKAKTHPAGAGEKVDSQRPHPKIPDRKRTDPHPPRITRLRASRSEFLMAKVALAGNESLMFYV
jgi:hypothetical protein